MTSDNDKMSNKNDEIPRTVDDTPGALQQDLQRMTPLLANGPANGEVPCRRCGTANPIGADVCTQCNSFLARNQKAREHGLYSKLPPPPDLQRKIDALRAGIRSDLGGDLSTLETSYVDKLGDIDVTISLLMHDIAAHGLFTRSGRVRSVYDKLLAGLIAYDRYAQRVGLQRRARPVQSLAELLAEHVE